MCEGIFSLAGVILGAGLYWAIDACRERGARERRAKYLAVRLASALDRYVGRCGNTAFDTGAPGPDEGPNTTPLYDLPSPPNYPDDVDWSCIEQDLMERIVLFLSRAEDLNREVRDKETFESYVLDYDVMLEDRQHRYAAIGLDAADLAKELRERFDIIAPTSSDRSVAERLEEVKGKIERRRREAEAKRDTNCFSGTPDP